MSIKLNAQSGGSVALDAPTQTTGSADITLKLPIGVPTIYKKPLSGSWFL